MGSEDNYPPWVVLIFVAGPLPDRGLESIIHASLHIPCLSMLSERIWVLKYQKPAFVFSTNCFAVKEWTISVSNIPMSDCGAWNGGGYLRS